MNQQPQHSQKKSPPKATGRIVLKITLYFVGAIIADFSLLGGSIAIFGSNVPTGCFIFSIDILALVGSIFIFFHKTYYIHCLSSLEYFFWLVGTTVVSFIAFVLVFAFTDPNTNHIASAIAVGVLAFYGISLMGIAHMKPPLVQQINESVYRILRKTPGKQIAVLDLFALLQKEYKHLTTPLNQYLENLDYIEPISLPGVPGIICRMKPSQQLPVATQKTSPSTRLPSPPTGSKAFTLQPHINQAAPSTVKNSTSNNRNPKPNHPFLADLSTAPVVPVPTPKQTPALPPQQTQNAIPASLQPVDKALPPSSQVSPPANLQPVDKILPPSSQVSPPAADKLNHQKPSASLSKNYKAIKTFCCYAHSDEQFLNKLKAHLQPQQRQGLIQIWYDRDISAGTEWKLEIEDQLNTAQIILLLVSPDFMASDYCYTQEMQQALERHARGEIRAIPIILKPVDWQITPLGKLQALPKDGKPITTWQNRDMAYLDVARGIRAVVETFLTLPQQQKNQASTQSSPLKEEVEIELIHTRCKQGKLIVTNKKIAIELRGFGQTFKSQTLLKSSLSSIDSKLAVAPLFGKGGGVNLTFRGRGKELLNADLVPVKEAKEIITLLSGH